MSEGVDEDRPLSFNFRWAPSRPLTQSVTPVSVSFTPDLMPVLTEAARLFREYEPQDDFELIGAVVRLARTAASGPGEPCENCHFNRSRKARSGAHRSSDNIRRRNLAREELLSPIRQLEGTMRAAHQNQAAEDFPSVATTR